MSTSLFIVLGVAAVFIIYALITGIVYLLEWLSAYKLRTFRYAAEAFFLNPEAEDLIWYELTSDIPVEPYYENDVLILDCPAHGMKRRYVRCIADTKHNSWEPVNSKVDFRTLWGASFRYARCRVWPNLK